MRRSSLFGVVLCAFALSCSSGGAQSTPSGTSAQARDAVRSAPTATLPHSTGSNDDAAHGSTGATSADAPVAETGSGVIAIPTAGASGPFLVRVITSRTHIVSGGAYGVSVQIKNQSHQPEMISIASLRLFGQPELNPSALGCAWVLKPTFRTQDVYFRPGDDLTVIFDLEHVEDPGPDGHCKPNRWLFWRSPLQRVSLQPGNYPFVLVGVYREASWNGDTTTWTTTGPFGTFTRTFAIPVALSQLSIVWIAGIGGLLGWLVERLHAPSSSEAAVDGQGTQLQAPLPAAAAGANGASHLTGRRGAALSALGAFVLGCTVTILAARLASTQFPIKVSVDDFWGSLTVGFLSYFVGLKFIYKLVGRDDAPKTVVVPPNPSANPTGRANAPQAVEGQNPNPKVV